MGALTGQFQENIITTRVDWLLNWARLSSIWPMTFGLACCAIEMMAVQTPRLATHRLGARALRATPRPAHPMVRARPAHLPTGGAV
ncbi:MAG: NADH-quinone oxidoreductase subunit B, partial [Planctomycetes bacterium]|nr:NADH-quinone oxidoreductase subunit B [Planctomycetota bacterium]